MIADLLPRYYEATGDDITYEALRSIVIRGHEVAWMKWSGTILYDIMNQSREGQRFTCCGVFCECDFRENVGWMVEAGQRYSLDGKAACTYRRKALRLRQLELRREYIEQFMGAGFRGDISCLRRNTPAIILNLIERVKAGEFIGEDGSGAAFWGGFFYLQTVAAITNQSVHQLWESANELVAQKKISLEGTVVQSYVEPPLPHWIEFVRLEEHGWTGIASLPSHRRMVREWKLEVLKPDGSSAYEHISGIPLLHDAAFGPDVEDVARVKARLHQLIRSA